MKIKEVDMTASSRPFIPRIAITMGDPCGVGPEIIVKAFASKDMEGCCCPLIVGEPLAFQRAIDLLDAELTIHPIENPSEIDETFRPGTLFIKSAGELTSADIGYGHPSRAACAAVVESIRQAVSWALEGLVDAIVTCPIHKANLHANGFSFPGHTEFLQELTHTPHVVMMLAGPRLRVSLATIHHALADVPRLLTPEILRQTIEITAQAMLRDFGVPSPRIAVAALNPHAGEAGRFGNEEMELIQPVIESLQSNLYRLSGPYSPDTLFHRAFQGEFDAVIAMYHDQGLIPIKLVHFYDAVNVTLGLPIVRTSVDHGTAYEIAGTGTANPNSLLEAVQLAATIASNRRQSPGQS